MNTHDSLLASLCARLLPAPDYCGDIVSRRFGLIRLVCIGDSRYIEIKSLGVWRLV